MYYLSVGCKKVIIIKQELYLCCQQVSRMLLSPKHLSVRSFRSPVSCCASVNLSFLCYQQGQWSRVCGVERLL